MAFAVTVTVKTNFERFGIYDEVAADQCEDAEGIIVNRKGDATKKFVFSAREERKVKPPGLITVSGSLEEKDAGGNTVLKDYSVQYPLNYGQALEFEFPTPPHLSTSAVIRENVDFDEFVVAIERGLKSIKQQRPKNG